MKKFAFLVVLGFLSTFTHAQDKGTEAKPPDAPKKTAPSNASKPKQKIGEPSTATDFLLRGTLKQEADDMVGALEDYNAAIGIDDKFPRAYLARGSVKFILQDFEAAMVDFNTTIELAEAEVEACNKRGHVKTILEDHKGATKEFNKSSALKPVLAEAFFNRGNVKYFSDDKTGCCEDLQKAGELGYLKAYNYIRQYCQD
ncbi:MAG: hypothetical protein JKY18_10680 [Flavobacteriales bacterium]|nr:hypothetical protein [Flavobacteriales bacterium]